MRLVMHIETDAGEGLSDQASVDVPNPDEAGTELRASRQRVIDAYLAIWREAATK